MQLYAIDPDYINNYLFKLENATTEERAAAFDKFDTVPLPDIVTTGVEPGVAYVNISGPMSPDGPGFLARFFGFGGTAYNDIAEAADTLRNDPDIKSVKLIMDTPGGTVVGVDKARSAIARLAAEKTVTAENHGMIASAGYYLASAVETITAVTPFAKTGSIGVIVAGIDISDAMARNGIKRVKIVSKNAPNKDNSVDTEHGREVIQDEIDATERVFIQTISEGRGITPQYIIDNFGKGGLLIAEDPDPDAPDALSVGMIDAVRLSAAPSDNEDHDNVMAGSTAFQDFPLVDQRWDGDVAVKRVREFLNAEDSPNKRYRQAFFWYNSEEAENFGAYKLSFVDIVDGRMVANIRGVNAASGSMAGARGQRVQIPEADRSRVQLHIDRYREKWQKRKGEGGNALGNDTAESGPNKTKETSMDLNQLKTDHPAIYQEAVSVGVTQERERVEAHITMGEAAGDIDLAMENIKSGAELSPSINAKYMAAGMNKQDMKKRDDESEPPVTPPGTEGADEEALAKATAEALGVEYDA